MVREAEKNDLNGILKLYGYLFPEENYINTADYENTWDEIMTNKKFFRYFVAFENEQKNEQIVATCCISIIPNLTRKIRSYALIENVITHPEKRKKGYGKMVINKAIEHAKSNNCYKVMLFSSSKRKIAHKFYKALGFNGDAKKGFYLSLL